jgi:hypothetical protein
MGHVILNSIQEDSAEDNNHEHVSEQPIFEGVGGEDPSDVGHSQFSVEDTTTDRLITGAMQVERLFQDDDTASLTNSNAEISDTDINPDENVPLKSEINRSYGHSRHAVSPHAVRPNGVECVRKCAIQCIGFRLFGIFFVAVTLSHLAFSLFAQHGSPFTFAAIPP